MFIKVIEDLEIYQIALGLSKEIGDLFESDSSLKKLASINQIIRSSESIPSNISEGFCQRFYPKQFLKYLFIALGSGDETQNHLRILCNKRLISEENKEKYIKKYKNLCIKILNLINYLNKKHSLKRNQRH